MLDLEEDIYETEEVDHGSHYRFTYTKKLTVDEIKANKVVFNLDPARIASIYNITDPMLFACFKKSACAGGRGFKDLRQDLNDIICAAQRKLQMLDEDGE